MTNSDLKINGRSGFVVVDEAPIMLSWCLDFEQIACRVTIKNNTSTIYQYESASNLSQHSIEEIELATNHQYDVEVLVVGHFNTSTLLSASFRSGNMGQFDGQWIYSGANLANPVDYYAEQRNPVIRKQLTLDSVPEEAYIHIVGLGYYHLYINGVRVTNSELNTDWTNYDKTVCYDTFDISTFLTDGSNELVVELGNGWYNPAPMTLFGKYNLREVLSCGEPTLLTDILLKDGDGWITIGSDESWQVSDGEWIFNNIYLGETYDFRHHEQRWSNSVVTDGPKGKLIPGYIPKIKQARAVKAQSISRLDDATVLVDFGQTIAGFIDISFLAQENQQVTLRYAEEIDAQGRVNSDSTLAGFIGKQIAPDFCIPGGEGAPERAEQRDRLYCKDGLNRFSNRFTFHSFRYVEISGLAAEDIESISAIYVHTRLEEKGQFRCSDPYLNKLYEIAKVTKQNNLHSVFADCARERLAYGGDIVALAQSQLYMFDNEQIYRKTIFDFIDDVRVNGGFPETAPFMGIKTNGTGDEAGPLAWQLVVSYLLNAHYQHYGDHHLVRKVFPYIEAQIQHFNSIPFEEITKFCLGDWGSILAKSEDVKNTSPAIGFTAVCIYYYHIKLAIRFAEILGDNGKVAVYRAQLDELKSKIITIYQNSDGTFSDRSQTSFIYALYFEFSDHADELMASLIHLIKQEGGQLTSGIFGQSFAYELFAKSATTDVVSNWLKCENGIANMLIDGNHALKEFFGDNRNGSCNHAMFSSYVAWLFKGLGGIQIHEDAVAADRVIIHPTFEPNLKFVECTYYCAKGKLASNWSRVNQDIELNIIIPNNMKQCVLILDKKYMTCLEKLNVICVDNSNVYIDITDHSSLQLRLQPYMVTV
jgi:alpha-L-rhamnosidase